MKQVSRTVSTEYSIPSTQNAALRGCEEIGMPALVVPHLCGIPAKAGTTSGFFHKLSVLSTQCIVPSTRDSVRYIGYCVLCTVYSVLALWPPGEAAANLYGMEVDLVAPVATPPASAPAVPAPAAEDPNDPKVQARMQEAAALMQKFTFLQNLQRSPALMLRMKAEQAAAAEKPSTPPKAPTPPAGPAKPPQVAKAEAEKLAEAKAGKQFSDEFITGDWKAIHTQLAAMPKDVGPKVYALLLAQLASGKSLVLPEDVLAIADAAPAGFDNAQVALLGRMLQQSRAQLGVPRAMLERLRAGTERLGGKDPGKRLAAARFLVAADMIDEARTYLPPMAEVLQKKDPGVLNLAALCEMQTGARRDDKQAVRRAWDLTGLVLAAPKVEDEDRTEALQRAISLLPQMPEKEVGSWIKLLANKQRPLCLHILAESAQMAENSLHTRDTAARTVAITAQHRLVKGLLDLAAKDPKTWAETIRMMTLGWVNEANYSINADSDIDDNDQQRSALAVAALGGQNNAAQIYGGQNYGGQNSGIPGRWPATRMRGERGNNEPQPLDAKTLLLVCPDENWRQAVDPDMARHIRRLGAIVAIEAGDQPQAFAGIRSCSQDDPKLARELAERYFGNWLGTLLSRTPDNSSGGYRGGYYSGATSYSRNGYGSVSYNGFQYNGGNSGGVPLIRAKQVRNLAALADELRALAELDVLPLHEDLLAAAFDACHSPAEIYREEDLQKVLGDLDSTSAGLLLQLALTMRTKLVGQWARPDVQDQSNTQRTDKDLVAEILRGYAMAGKMLAAAERRAPEQPAVMALRASLNFDQSEFLYGQKADLKTYTALRDRAFADFAKAAETYARGLKFLPPEQQSPQIYMRWFQSALGASDLAYLTRQDRPDADQIERIAAAVRHLDAKASDRHLAMFGEAVTAAMGEVPPQLKPHFLRSALRILGNHEAGNPARERLKFYDELLGEVQVHAEVDGSADVGQGQSFGVRLSVRYTSALGRESGGFTSLLGKANINGVEVDHPKVIEQTIGEKLGQTFEVETVRFQDPKLASRGFGRPGWMETPLAYLILRAKTGSVDRIPVIPIDLDFNDGSGMVLLPVISQVVLIDARNEHPAPRPYQDMKMRQLWDDRHLSSGTAQVEVMATAHGLIPTIDHLLNLGPGALPGFRVTKVQDQRLELKSLDASGDQIQPLTERRWTIDVAPDTEAHAPPTEFVFPTAAAPAIAIEHQRYDDADVAAVGATVPLRTVVTARQIGLWIGGGIAVAAIAALAVWAWLYASRRRRVEHAGPKYHRPDPLTPFSLVVLLKRIHSDGVIALSEGERKSLAATIADLEQRYFQRSTAAAAPADLSALLDRWLKAAGNGHAPRARSDTAA
jgi:hypothetical protein